MGSVSVRLSKTNAVGGAQAHALRAKVPEYVDTTRTHLNHILEQCQARFRKPDSAETLRKRMNHRSIGATGRSMRRDTRLIWDGIITFSSDSRANEIDRQQLDACAIRFMEMLLEQYWGAIHAAQRVENTLWLVRHEDETTVHYHFALVNQACDNSRPIRLNRGDLRKIQDLAGRAFEPVGLSRGKPKTERIKAGEPAHQIIHRTVRELHEDLPRELEQAKAKLAKYKRLIDANSQKLLALQAQVANQQQEIERLEKRLQTYKRRENDALERLRSLSAAISTLEHVLDDAQMKAISDAIESVERAYDDDFLNDPMGNQHSGGFKPSS